jgi:hypothetical protein
LVGGNGLLERSQISLHGGGQCVLQ